MKRIALSLAVIASSAAYVLERPRDPPLDPPLPTASSEEALPDGQPIPHPAASPVTAPGRSSPLNETSALARSDGAEESDEATPTQVTRFLARVPLPRLRVTPSAPKASSVVAKAGAPVLRIAAATPAVVHADGTFVGSVENAYYGLVQVEAGFAQGKLVSVRVLRYPSDRRTSIYINSRALPALRREAIAAQSAHVDIVSGATLTSRAFARSLDAAFNRAGA